jgi:hypothetical protein
MEEKWLLQKIYNFLMSLLNKRKINKETVVCLAGNGVEAIASEEFGDLPHIGKSFDSVRKIFSEKMHQNDHKSLPHIQEVLDFLSTKLGVTEGVLGNPYRKDLGCYVTDDINRIPNGLVPGIYKLDKISDDFEHLPKIFSFMKAYAYKM